MIPKEKLFAVYEADGREGALAGSVEALFQAQLQAWELFAANHTALKQVETRVLSCKDAEGRYDVAVQWNPKRLQSTGAKIDRSAPRERSCFLCLENLPLEQMGILYEERFLILCNPMPIFDRHFTVADIRHVPQVLAAGSIASMLRLSRDLGSALAVFYNGSACGASAPDHLHFQACPVSCLPDRHIAVSSAPEKKIGDTSIHVPDGLGRAVVLLKGPDVDEMIYVVDLLIKTLNIHQGGDGEPMVNVIVSRRTEGWFVAIYPRKRHRPDKYDAPMGERFLVSPGAVDMSGVIIMPIEEEFRRIGASDIQTIYSDVAMAYPDVRKIIQFLPE